ncbi:uncharacterized protein [Oscarella lobularis]|uniref:uncharacterized protein n=1 Tax=Oscarella lobularis TaxID=121494 RepID=UPI0033142662
MTWRLQEMMQQCPCSHCQFVSSAVLPRLLQQDGKKRTWNVLEGKRDASRSNLVWKNRRQRKVRRGARDQRKAEGFMLTDQSKRERIIEELQGEIERLESASRLLMKEKIAFIERTSSHLQKARNQIQKRIEEENSRRNRIEERIRKERDSLRRSQLLCKTKPDFPHK